MALPRRVQNMLLVAACTALLYIPMVVGAIILRGFIDWLLLPVGGIGGVR